MSKSCPQCVRIRVVVPEAVHQLSQLPGLSVLSSDGSTVQAMATPEIVEQLRGHRLIREVQVQPTPAAQAEGLEPWGASIGNGLVELLHQPAVQIGLLALFLRLLVGRR